MKNNEKYIVDIYCEKDPGNFKMQRFANYLSEMILKYFDDVWLEIENLDVNENEVKNSGIICRFMNEP